MKNKKYHHLEKETVLAAVLVFLVLAVMWKLAPWQKDEDANVTKVPEIPKVRRLIDGVFVESGKEKPPIVGVIVENMIEAQPLSGIADANLVFEAVAEANITRFLAYFTLEDGQEVSEIGSVRSARPYYLDWAAEFDTIFAHVGSSPAAYDLLRGQKGVEGVYDLDQWYRSTYYFEKKGRPKPHHQYTSIELLKKAYEEDKPTQKFDSWKFKNDAPPDLRGDVQDIKIRFFAPYDVEWLYDKSLNQYKRMQWNGIHKDAQGKEIITKNIAVAFEEMEILDKIGRKKFKTIGEGEGLVFQDGRVVVGKWKKLSARERMRFYDAQGNEVEFNGGVTWVEIVPKGYEVKY